MRIKLSLSLVLVQGTESRLTWDPEELSYQDVACLYSAEADGWTVIDEYLRKSYDSHMTNL